MDYIIDRERKLAQVWMSHADQNDPVQLQGHGMKQDRIVGSHNAVLNILFSFDIFYCAVGGGGSGGIADCLDLVVIGRTRLCGGVGIR